jgi:sugar transferase (PEP-CTERM/EpsH1 system associated)
MPLAADIVVHLLYRFEFGGIQSLLAECIGRTTGPQMRHVVICLADYDLAAIKTLGDVELIALNKEACGTWSAHRKLFTELRRLKPALLHTYNIGTIEYAFTGTLAGVPRRVHAEHGRGMGERLGTNKKYNLLRRILSPFIETFVSVTDDMVVWLHDTVTIPKRKVMLIRNGIDIERFHPKNAGSEVVTEQSPASAPIIIGTVGRLDAIKAQADLIDAYILLRDRFRDSPTSLFLVIIGEGPLSSALAEKIRAAGIENCVWMPGARQDIAEILRSLSVFVLPSISEASPITLLEAMATGIPVVATRVGGIPDLVGNNLRGTLVAPSDFDALADAIAYYVTEPSVGCRHANAARRFVVENYNIEATVDAYRALYASPPLLCK